MEVKVRSSEVKVSESDMERHSETRAILNEGAALNEGASGESRRATNTDVNAYAREGLSFAASM